MWLTEIAQDCCHIMEKMHRTCMGTRLRNVHENKIALLMLSRNPDWIGCQQRTIECETGDLYVRELQWGDPFV